MGQLARLISVSFFPEAIPRPMKLNKSIQFWRTPRENCADFSWPFPLHFTDFLII